MGAREISQKCSVVRRCLDYKWIHPAGMAMAGAQKTDGNKCWGRWGEIRTLGGGNVWGVVQPLWKNNLAALLKQLNTESPHDLPSQVCARQNRKRVCPQNASANVRGGSIHNSRERKQPTCLVGERTKRAWSTRAMEYYSAVKKE